MPELHNRLSHLVNYSSQLIFVSGDSVAVQQRTLNDFLSQQQENTEISFLSATHDQTAKDYRSHICRQLGGHTVGSFVRPLNQLLIDLSAENGPYLLCITQAECLDKEFLQELWDWVMHAQQFNAHLHLNVILFGRSDWAQSSQEWLPSQNSHKPVLLSSQSVDAVGFDVNALEALMAQDSQWFSGSASPLVTNKWFITSVLGVFLCVFIGLISLQYPSEVKAFLAGNTPTETELPAFNITAADIGKEIITSTDELINTKVYQQQIEVIEEENITDSLLVSNWKNETSVVIEPVTNLDLISPDLTNPETSEELQVETVSEESVALPIQPEQERLESSVTGLGNEADIDKPVADSEFDFQVPDIISVEQLEAQLAVQSELQSGTQATRALQSQTAPQNSQNKGEIPVNDDLAIDYQFDETTLLSLPTDAIVLQLSGIQNPVVLENYLSNNNLKANTWVYETQRYGGPWYVVVYRQSFDSIDSALNRLTSLPDDVRNAQPFAKSINQIHQEIQQR